MNKKIAGGLFFIMIILVVAYLLFLGEGREGYEGISIHAEQIPLRISGALPPHTCFVGGEPGPPGSGVVRLTFATSFYIVNYGKEIENGSKIYMVFNGEKVMEKDVEKEHPKGDVIFGKKVDFIFTRDFKGEMDPVQIYNRKVNFPYQLVFCNTACDPTKDGLVFYENTTEECYRIPCSACKPI